MILGLSSVKSRGKVFLILEISYKIRIKLNILFFSMRFPVRIDRFGGRLIETLDLKFQNNEIRMHRRYPHTFEMCVAQSGGYPEVPEPEFLLKIRK